MSNVKHFGAVGDGEADDTEAIRHALERGDGALAFPRGEYRISETIEVPLDETGRTSITGSGGVAKIVHAGPGPAFKLIGTHAGTASPLSVEPNVWSRQRMPTVAGIEIEGAHEEADGLAFTHTMQAILDGVAVRGCRHAVHFIERNRNAIVTNCQLYHNRGVGVFLDHVNLHQINVIGCHISYNARGGVRVVGSELRNLQLTGCDIEYNNIRTHDDLDPEPTAELYIDSTAAGASVAEVTVASNTLQATPTRGGANIRMLGNGGRLGLITITGNVIGNQENAIHLSACSAASITGNILYSSERHTLLVEDARQITVSANNSRRHTPRLGFGYRFVNCQDCIIADNHLADESEAGQDSGHSPLELSGCRRFNITGCQIIDGAPYGIDLDDCSQVSIANCQILETREQPAARAAIRWRGAGRGNRVMQNTLTRGTTDTLALDDEAAVRTADNVVDGD